MLRLVLLFSFCCFHLYAFCSRTLFTPTDSANPDSLIADNLFAFKLSPLSAINVFDGVSLNVGLEKKIFKNYSFCINGGPYFSYSNKGLGTGSTGYFVNPEVRMYLNRRSKCEGIYLSLDYKYKDNSFNWTDSFFVKSPTGNLKYEKDYRIRTIAHSFNLKGGFTILEKFLIVDFFVGAGVKIRNTTVTLTEDEKNGLMNVDDYSTFQIYRSTWGNYVWPNITMGIKIGFFKSSK
jgi:hypothetical protein